MKAYINKIIKIENNNADLIDWQNVLKDFKKFEDHYTIFNQRSDKSVHIQIQKISLDEKEMAEFLSSLNEISFLYGVEINTCPTTWKFNAETDRITVSIN